MSDSRAVAKKPQSFQLSKWYLDCVTDKGDGAIVYIAELRWRRWHVHFANALLFLGNAVTSKSSIRHCELPESSNGEIAVRNPHLGVEGVWRRSATPIERKIYAKDDEEVVWHCLQPASHVKLQVEGSAEMNGLGYAERLQMSIAPWNLPLTELHWGRFISEHNHLVWIDWRGSHCHRLLVHNGSSYQAASINEQEVSAADSNLRLTLDGGLVLRSGDLGNTVLPTLTHLLKALPDSLFKVHECKWRSQGVLTRGRDEERGWAIHEIVRWRQG